MDDRPEVRARAEAEAVIASAGTLALIAGRKTPQRTENRCATTDRGIVCVADRLVVDAVREEPRVSFTVEEPSKGRLVAGEGRAIILDRIDEAGPAEHGLPAEMKGILIVPHTLTYSEGAEETMVDFPYGGRPPSRFAVWAQATRPFSFTASIMPMIVGAALAWYLPPDGADTAWRLLPLVILAGLLFHIGTNLTSDYYDYARGVDRVGTMGGSGVLVNGLMPARHVLIGGLVAFVIGSALGFVMLTVRGWPLLALGLGGLIGGFFYCGWPIHWKYRGLGEFGVFTLMGPLMTIGAYYVVTGGFRWEVLAVSLPVGFLVAAILQANDLRDIADDRASSITTMSMASGHRAATIEYYLMVGGAYLSVILMVAFGVLPLWALVVFLSVPPAIKVVRTVHNARGRGTEIAIADVMTAQVHLAFTVLLAMGIVLGKLL